MEKEKVPQKVKYLGGEWEGELSVIKGKTYKCLVYWTHSCGHSSNSFCMYFKCEIQHVVAGLNVF